MPWGEFIPVQYGRDTQDTRKGGYRDEAQPDSVPVLGSDHHRKEISPADISRSEHHGAHHWLDRPGEQQPAVIGEEVQHPKGYNQNWNDDPSQHTSANQHSVIGDAFLPVVFHIPHSEVYLLEKFSPADKQNDTDSHQPDRPQDVADGIDNPGVLEAGFLE